MFSQVNAIRSATCLLIVVGAADAMALRANAYAIKAGQVPRAAFVCAQKDLQEQVQSACRAPKMYLRVNAN